MSNPMTEFEVGMTYEHTKYDYFYVCTHMLIKNYVFEKYDLEGQLIGEVLRPKSETHPKLKHSTQANLKHSQLIANRYKLETKIEYANKQIDNLSEIKSFYQDGIEKIDKEINEKGKTG